MSRNPRMQPDGSVEFSEVSSERPRQPSWLSPAKYLQNDPIVASLRPPRVPRIALEMVEEAGSRPVTLPPGSVGAWLGDFDSVRPRPISSMPPPNDGSDILRGGEGTLRRVDTVIDDLNPRADEEAVMGIASAVRDVVAARQEQLDAAEGQLLQLVSVIARRVIARELSLDPSVIRGVVAEGVLALAENDEVTVRLGDFYSEVVHLVEAAVSQTGVRAHVSVDPSLGDYACRIETRWGSVDESLEERLGNLLEGISIYPRGS